MNILEKIDEYLTEDLGPKFWNNLIDIVNRKWGSHVHKELAIMLRQSKDSDFRYMMMVNTFNELPKEFVNIVKKSIKLTSDDMGFSKVKAKVFTVGKGESIDEKARKITLSDEHWKQVFKGVKKAK